MSKRGAETDLHRDNWDEEDSSHQTTTATSLSTPGQFPEGRIIKKPVSRLNRAATTTPAVSSSAFASAFTATPTTATAIKAPALKAANPFSNVDFTAPSTPFTFGQVEVQKPAVSLSSASVPLTFAPVSFSPESNPFKGLDKSTAAAAPVALTPAKPTVPMSVPSATASATPPADTAEIDTFVTKMAGLNKDFFAKISALMPHFAPSLKAVAVEHVKDYSPLLESYVKYVAEIKKQHPGIEKKIMQLALDKVTETSLFGAAATPSVTPAKAPATPFATSTKAPSEVVATPEILPANGKFSFGNVGEVESPAPAKPTQFFFGASKASEPAASIGKFPFSSATSAKETTAPSFSFGASKPAAEESPKTQEPTKIPSATATISFGSAAETSPTQPSSAGFSFGAAASSFGVKQPTEEVEAKPSFSFGFGSQTFSQPSSQPAFSFGQAATTSAFSFGVKSPTEEASAPKFSSTPGGFGAAPFSFGASASQPASSANNEEGDDDDEEDKPLEIERPKVGAGEEAEIVEHEARCKLYRWEGASNVDLGINFLKINHDEAKKSWRFLSRQEGSSTVTMNARISKQLTFQPAGTKGKDVILFVPEIVDGQSKLTKYHVRLKDEDMTKAFTAAIESVMARL